MIEALFTINHLVNIRGLRIRVKVFGNEPLDLVRTDYGRRLVFCQHPIRSNTSRYSVGGQVRTSLVDKQGAEISARRTARALVAVAAAIVLQGGELEHAFASKRHGGASGFLPEGHVDQRTLPGTPVEKIADWGRWLFSAEFTREDGVGSNLSGDPAGTVRFARIPRMDLPGFAMHPFRTTGPNSQSCVACHSIPFTGGGGRLADMEIRDSLRTGDPFKYVHRNPVHLFGSGALQLLAEQITQELKALHENAARKAASTGQPVTVELTTSNGVNYGKLTVDPAGSLDTKAVVGIDPDLIVRPYTWKGGFVTFLRPLVSLGTELEMGMQPAEFFGDAFDFDGDGVTNEMSVGDITAMTVYIASLPRPVTELELSDHLGGKYTLSQAERSSIVRGKELFNRVGCAECHTPAMKVKSALFKEPSSLPEHRFPMLPTGQDPVSVGLDHNNPVVINLALNPQIGLTKNDAACRERGGWWNRDHGKNALCFLQYEYESDGSIVVSLYGDLKRHDMGPALAENIDEAGTGATVWKTRELWGVGNTGPWLHDGRATTLEEAIFWHGGEAQVSRDRYAGLSERDRQDIVRFLKNLVLFKPGQDKPGSARD